MEYSDTLKQELLNMNFELSSVFSDSEISYDVYKLNHLEVTLDHTNKKVGVDLVGFEDETINITTLAHLGKVIQALDTIYSTL